MAEPSILRDAVVYLGAAVVCVPVAKRLGLGSVLGYLLAGCLIGPWGLGLISDVQSILHFAEFGVVLMLFLIGLELDVTRLWQMRGPVFGGGLLQMCTCAAALGLGLAALGLPWQAALVAGLSLAMSSTAIAVQTMGERNLIATPAGKAAFAVLLFQDIAAIPLIALVPLLGAGGVASQSGWLGAVNAIAAIVAVVVIGRFLTRPLLRAIAGTGIREVFTAFALLLVIGIAQLMTEAGLSMALGAFLAGVLLASSEYRHALETDIAPFKGLLLGLFFIAIGMSIDFGLMLAQPALLAVLVVGLLAAKGAALWGIARALGVAGRERLLFAALLAQGGEFAFVVFAVAREARVLPGNWEALLTASVALSMAATPLLLLGFDQLCDRDAQRGAEADEIDDDSAPVIIAGFGRYGQIVARVLAMHDIASTVLDHDPDQIELLRRFGSKVFYGDATRLDLLEAAGAAKARLLVVAIDEMDESLKLVDLVRQHFPNLAIVARARNVRHYLELRERGIDSVERETFDAALRTGRSALERLGVGAFEAREIAESFRRYNQKYLDSSLPYFRDEKRSVAMVKDARQQLEEQLRNDREARSREREGGWG